MHFFIDKKFFQNLLYESTLKAQKMNLKPVIVWFTSYDRNLEQEKMLALGQHLVSKILVKIQGTEKLTDLENLGTR